MTENAIAIEILTGNGTAIMTGPELWYQIAQLPTPCRVIIRGARGYDMSFVPWVRPEPDAAGKVEWL